MSVFSVEALRKEYARGNRYKYVFFWGHTPGQKGAVDKSCLSQWWKTDFIVDGKRYSCTEQYMMAEKARLFGDEEMEQKIMEAKHPKQMKEYGRAVRNFNEQIWNDKCYQIVLAGNYAKFSQNDEIKEYLLNTGNRIFVEASPVDKIWGIKMAATDPNVENPMKWKGKNYLGFALTEVREKIKGELE